MLRNRKGIDMFNNIWRALSSNIWPFTVAILNLWAIFKLGGFIVSVVIESFVKAYKDMHRDQIKYCRLW